MDRKQSVLDVNSFVAPLRRLASLGLVCLAAQRGFPQSNDPVVLDTNLTVTAVITNLDTPTSMAFLKANDFFVLEKGSGRVQRVMTSLVTNAMGVVTTDTVVTTVLDLPVNSASERGLLGIALHPRFPLHPAVYLYWTESSTGADSGELADVPLLGNRVDRFHWDGSTLTFETNVIRLHAFQMDEGQTLRGNHNGGVIRFGPDRKLYIYIGDNGRRGQMQNLPDGPSAAGNMPDDQFGGPEPDNAHLTGVILRLNEDGTIPTDNPFYRAGFLRGGEAGTNLAKVFAYGIRNGFGMAFDPLSGSLWEAQNGDDSFTEINMVEPGFNLGWIQVMGPLSRIAEWKAIETSSNFFGLQQIRWSPTNIADTAAEALSRMFWVYEGGNRFAARLIGSQEVPPVTTDAAAIARFAWNEDGTLAYELRASGSIHDAIMAHIHLGARGQNGPVVAFLLQPGTNSYEPGDLIAKGTLTDADVIAMPRFTNTIAELVERMRQGRAYANLHTLAHPGGEIRGEIVITDRTPVSRYSDPEFSWKYEVAPASIGFVQSTALGSKYLGDMLVGAARDFLQGGTLFRFDLKWGRTGRFDVPLHNENDDDQGREFGGRRDRFRLTRTLAFSDPRLQDRVADNLDKFDITESESLLFGTNFGIVTDIHTAPDGKVYVVSLSHGAVYKIHRVK